MTYRNSAVFLPGLRRLSTGAGQAAERIVASAMWIVAGQRAGSIRVWGRKGDILLFRLLMDLFGGRIEAWRERQGRRLAVFVTT